MTRSRLRHVSSSSGSSLSVNFVTACSRAPAESPRHDCISANNAELEAGVRKRVHAPGIFEAKSCCKACKATASRLGGATEAAIRSEGGRDPASRDFGEICIGK